MNSIGRDVVGVRGDLDRLYETVTSKKGRVDRVFANAGVGESAVLEKVTRAHFDRLFDTNVKGVLLKPRHDLGNNYVQDRLQKTLPEEGKLPEMEEEKCFVVQSDRRQTCRERGAHAQTTM